jgi:hypothetical protein
MNFRKLSDKGIQLQSAFILNLLFDDFKVHISFFWNSRREIIFHAYHLLYWFYFYIALL